MYFVYLLESLKDGGWYIGFSEEVNQRVIFHNAGNNASTKERRPLRLIYYEAYLCKKDALGREKFLKSGSGHRFLKRQLTHFLSGKLQS
jgi:putative endonuclease